MQVSLGLRVKGLGRCIKAAGCVQVSLGLRVKGLGRCIKAAGCVQVGLTHTKVERRKDVGHLARASLLASYWCEFCWPGVVRPLLPVFDLCSTR